jgi:hypothetical protein
VLAAEPTLPSRPHFHYKANALNVNNKESLWFALKLWLFRRVKLQLIFLPKHSTVELKIHTSTHAHTNTHKHTRTYIHTYTKTHMFMYRKSERERHKMVCVYMCIIYLNYKVYGFIYECVFLAYFY